MVRYISEGFINVLVRRQDLADYAIHASGLGQGQSATDNTVFEYSLNI